MLDPNKTLIEQSRTLAESHNLHSPLYERIESSKEQSSSLFIQVDGSIVIPISLMTGMGAKSHVWMYVEAVDDTKYKCVIMIASEKAKFCRKPYTNNIVSFEMSGDSPQTVKTAACDTMYSFGEYLKLSGFRPQTIDIGNQQPEPSEPKDPVQKAPPVNAQPR